MKKIVLFLTLIMTSTFVLDAQAAMSPLSVAILPPIQFPSSDFSVVGVRASVLWGKHRDMYGVDIGLLGNVTDQEFVGIGVSGLFNVTQGSTTIIGLQLAGAANVNTNKVQVFGLQLALGANYNSASASVGGLQVAAVNWSPHTNIYGAQIGIYNKALVVRGFQIGLVNSATNLYGIQIGLINFHHQGLFSVSPIINVGF